jgi:dTDP-glucose 4,6-dehydratase
LTGACRGLPASDLAELLSVSPSPWKRLDGARILITGATGLIGRWCLATLLAAVDGVGLDASVLALVRDQAAWSKTSFASHPRVEALIGDLRDFSFPARAPTHVLHLAAPSPAVQTADPLAAFDLLVGGTRRVLELSARAKVQGFLLASSGAVYGRGPKSVERVPEGHLEGPDQLSDPNAAYDEGKRACETLCGLYARLGQVPAAVARIFPVIGPGMPLDGHHAAGNFIRDALSGGPIRVGGDGSPVRSYLYLADAAWWLWTILASGRPGRAYNVGGESAVTVKELASLVASRLDPRAAVAVSGAPGSEAPSRHVPAVDRAREELGLRQRVSLAEAIDRTLAWHRAGLQG